MKSKEQKSKIKNKILFLVFSIALVLVGFYGIFVSLTGGMEYVNSPDKRIVNAEVIRVKHTFEKDDDGNLTGEKWAATLRYIVDGKEYTTKKTFSTKTYSGETVQIEVYKTSTGKYKASGTSMPGFVISASVLLFGIEGLITENKDRKKKKQKIAKQNKKQNEKTEMKVGSEKNQEGIENEKERKTK